MRQENSLKFLKIRRMSDYKNRRIIDIRRGSGKRSHLSATLDYIVEPLAERIPVEENEVFGE